MVRTDQMLTAPLTMTLRLCVLYSLLVVALGASVIQHKRNLYQALCSELSFVCGDNRCILNNFVCDLDEDCEDGSDEFNCPNDCSGANQFKCDNGKCLGKSRTCNRHNDCGDNSDESYNTCYAASHFG